MAHVGALWVLEFQPLHLELTVHKEDVTNDTAQHVAIRSRVAGIHNHSPAPPGPQWTTISHTCVRSSMYEHCVTEGPEAGLLSMY